MSKILIATTCRWVSAARIALAAAGAHADVDVVCPAGHPALGTSVLRKSYRYSGLRPLFSFQAAIEASRPDLVVPADDLAATHLQKLHARAQRVPELGWMAQLIERSLGDPAHYGVAHARARFLKMAADLGIPVPATEPVGSTAEVAAWVERHRLPAVLKADGTTGGEGVAVVSTLDAAVRAYRRLRAPLATAVVAKRAGLDRDTRCLRPWILRHSRQVSIQPWIEGRDANLALACWKGEILAAVAVEVVQNRRNKGPAAVVRRIQNAPMMEAARAVARRLGLSGLCGFDFLIDSATGVPWLIEINARATQTCHLPDREGVSPVGAIVAASRTPQRRAPASQRAIPSPADGAREAELIALFPLAWQINPENEWLKQAYWDLPEDEPQLIESVLRKEEQFSYERWARIWMQRWARLRRQSDPGLPLRERNMSYRILHLIGSNCVGGPEKQILHHACDLQGSIHDLWVGSFHDLEERPEIVMEAERCGLRTVCLPGGVRPGVLAALLRELLGHSIDLLCTHGFKANVVGYLAAKKMGLPHVAFLRGWTAETAKVIVYEMLERQVLARAPWVVCVSEQQAVEVAKLRKAGSRPIVIRNAMLPPFARPSELVPVTRAGLGIPEDAFVFGSVGRLSAEKGHRYLIEAFAELCGRRTETGQPLHLVMVGDGREQPALEKQAAESGVRERVYFAGFQGNCAEWMQLFDCMVQPSLTEGTPNSVLEALCLRLPVVATAVGGVPDLIQQEQNGLLTEAADSPKLAAAMDRMLGDAQLRHQLSHASEALLDEYSPECQRRRLESVYAQALGLESQVHMPEALLAR
jgi:glycosyltransferase involved in cell wall biosynthesis